MLIWARISLFLSVGDAVEDCSESCDPVTLWCHMLGPQQGLKAAAQLCGLYWLCFESGFSAGWASLPVTKSCNWPPHRPGKVWACWWFWCLPPSHVAALGAAGQQFTPCTGSSADCRAGGWGWLHAADAGHNAHGSWAARREGLEIQFSLCYHPLPALHCWHCWGRLGREVSSLPREIQGNPVGEHSWPRNRLLSAGYHHCLCQHSQAVLVQSSHWCWLWVLDSHCQPHPPLAHCYPLPKSRCLLPAVTSWLEGRKDWCCPSPPADTPWF